MKPRWNEGYEPKLVHDHRNLERGGQCLRENPKEKQQVPPLRYAPVGMTILFGYPHPNPQQNCHPDRSVA
jgi:hypothetical protein